jgi:hypothetical protein
MERATYLALVHREANVLVDEREELVRSSIDDAEGAAELTSSIERQVEGILSEVDHLEDVIKWADLREPDPGLWRDASSWQGVLIGAAMAVLVADIRSCAQRIIDGELPRLKNIQVEGAGR